MIRRILFVSVFAVVALAGVLELDASEFEKLTAQDKLIVVKYYAPFCHYCKDLAPHYSNAAKRFNSVNNVVFGEVDCTKNKKLCRSQGIRGYPTVLMHDGPDVSYRFRGERTVPGIVDWVHSLSSPLFTPMDTPHEPYFRACVGNAEEGQAQAAIIEQLAKENYLIVPFVRDLDCKLGTEYIRAFVDGSQYHLKLSEANEEAIRDFVLAHRLSVLPEITGRTFGLLTANKEPLAMFAIDPQIEEHVVLRESAVGIVLSNNPLPQPSSFGWLNSTEWKNYLQRFGVGSSDLPAVVTLDLRRSKHKSLKNVVDLEQTFHFINESFFEFEQQAKKDILFQVETLFNEHPLTVTVCSILGVILVVVLFGLCCYRGESSEREIVEDDKPKQD